MAAFLQIMPAAQSLFVTSNTFGNNCTPAAFLLCKPSHAVYQALYFKQLYMPPKMRILQGQIAVDIQHAAIIIIALYQPHLRFVRPCSDTSAATTHSPIFLPAFRNFIFQGPLPELTLLKFGYCFCGNTFDFIFRGIYGQGSQ